MEPVNYAQLKDYLTGALKTAKKLGLNVEPGGGYSMGYDINNLPPYPVGLFGALSIVEGAGARCKLGLTFDQTQTLEAGFNGSFPSNQNKKKKKRSLPPDMELMKIGAELTLLFQSSRRPTARFGNSWDAEPMGMPVKKANIFDDMQANAAGDAWPAPKKKKSLEAALMGAKKKHAKVIEKVAQAAPQENIGQKVMEIANEIAKEVGVLKEIKQMPEDPGIWKMAVQWDDDAHNKHWEVVAVNPHGEQEIMDAGFEKAPAEEEE